MARSHKPKIRNAGNRSGGGRPRSDGDRYPNGKLKPQKPNDRTMQMRASLGVTDIGQAFSPIQVAARKGWLSADDCRIAATFASIHTIAGLGRASSAAGAGHEVAPRTDVSGDPAAASFFATLPHSEVVAIWDAVFTSEGSPASDREDRATKAMAQWKAANAAMTPEQRSEVYDVCILDSFPQWIIQRAAGRMNTSWERKRDLLIAGLRAVGGALRPAPSTRPDSVDRFEQPDFKLERCGEGASVRRDFYVDQDNHPLFEVERVYRVRRAA
ncbi:MAG: hypothetical protein ACRED4_07150 [Brevundimonas sp.]